MFGLFGTVLEMVINACLWCFKILAFIIIPIMLIIGITFLIYHFKGYRMKKRETPSTYKDTFFLKKIFIDFPNRFVKDMYNRNPDDFPIDGLHLFAGEQGSGKSIAAVEMAMRMQSKYPSCKIYSNIDLNFQDGKIKDWQTIVSECNDRLGVLFFIDEIQNWFNSSDSRNFPPEMLQEICQLRKQTKCVVATSQVFARVAKPIREQVRVLYKPITVLGCLTIVRAYKPLVRQDGTIEKLRKIKTYFFVHSDKLRNAYDTYEKVLTLSKNGFKPVSERIENSGNNVVNNSIFVSSKTKK